MIHAAAAVYVPAFVLMHLTWAPKVKLFRDIKQFHLGWSRSIKLLQTIVPKKQLKYFVRFDSFWISDGKERRGGWGRKKNPGFTGVILFPFAAFFLTGFCSKSCSFFKNSVCLWNGEFEFLCNCFYTMS